MSQLASAKADGSSDPKARQWPAKLNPVVDAAFCLVPCESDCAKLQPLIDEVSAKMGGYRCTPHLTIATGFTPLSASDLARLADVFRDTPPLELKTTGFGAQADFFKSAYLSLSGSEALLELRSLIQRMFGFAAAHFEPHLSLCYADVELGVKMDAIGALCLPKGLHSLAFDRCTLITPGPDGDIKKVDEWQTPNSWSLSAVAGLATL